MDNVLVEKEQLASAVVYNTNDRPDILIEFSLNSVASEKLKEVEARFFELLKETASKPLDMKYMHDCIDLERRQIKFIAETSNSHFTQPVISDFLFGSRDGATLKRGLIDLRDLEALEKWADDEWRKWLRIWLSEAKHISVLGKPSAALSEKTRSEEQARLAARRQDLGESGLQHLREELAKAKEENDVEVPKEVLEKFGVPSTDSIKFIETTTARSGSARRMGRLENPIQEVIDREGSELSLFIHFEHIKSNFANVCILVSTDKIPIILRPLLAIYIQTFFSSPMVRNGERIDFEEVIKDLDRDLVGYGLEQGQAFGNAEPIAIKVQVEVEKYDIAIRWLKDLMFSSILDLERIATTTTRLLAEIPDEKRSGSGMKSAVNEIILTKPNSTARAQNTLVQALYLKHVKKLLQEDPDTIVKQLEEIRQALWQPCNFRALVIADVKKLQNPANSWTALTDGLDTKRPLDPLETRISRLSDLGKDPRNTAFIIPLPPIDSSFATCTAKGPSSYNDPVVPILMVAFSFLNAVEGPLWTAVRGAGLAYGVNIYNYIDVGQIALSIYRSPDASKAFTASKQVVSDYAFGKLPIDDFALEGAISAIVLEFADGEATAMAAARVSFVRQVVRGQEKDWPRKALEKVRQVSKEQIRTVLKEIAMPLFDASSSALVVTAAPIMQQNLEKGLSELGYKAQIKPLADFQDDYGFKVDDIDDDDDEEEDDEDDEEGDEDGEEIDGEDAEHEL